MFKSRKASQREQNLEKAVELLQLQVDELRSRCSTLVISSKRWAKKFSNPVYRVPQKIIAQMKLEIQENESRTRAKIDELAARNAILQDRILDMTEERCKDLFGSVTGNSEITFEEATSHMSAAPLESDHEDIALELEEKWAERMQKHAAKSSQNNSSSV